MKHHIVENMLIKVLENLINLIDQELKKLPLKNIFQTVFKVYNILKRKKYHINLFRLRNKILVQLIKSKVSKH